MLRILIFGSKGFIGSNLIGHLRNISLFDVYGADVIQDYEDPKYFVIDATVANFNIIFQKFQFDYCINCSGAASVSDSLKNPFRDYHLNTYNVFGMLEAIRIAATGCKFITISSAAIYGEPQYLPISEDHQERPKSPYGMHKLQAEQICEEYRKFYGIETCCLRVFSAYGPGLKKQLLWDIYQKLKSGLPLDLWGTGNESRDFIYISDILILIELLVKEKELKYPIMNVASGIETKIVEIATKFIEILNYSSSELKFTGESRAGDPQNWRADISKMLSLGFQPRYSLLIGLTEYSEWLQENQN